jgi:hypothetical protein
MTEGFVTYKTILNTTITIHFEAILFQIPITIFKREKLKK